jgi:hypothetical protein
MGQNYMGSLGPATSETLSQQEPLQMLSQSLPNPLKQAADFSVKASE